MSINDRPRRAFRRRAVRVEVTLRLKPPEAVAKTVQGLTLVGFTRNISESGMALVVSASNIDRYLRQRENSFLVRLNLPTRALELQAIPVYFKKISSGGAISYLIGASFQNLDDDKLSELVRFLRSLPPPSSGEV